MLQAIVYTSYAGTTAQYAHLLGEKTGLPVLSLKEADKSLAPGAKVIYLGWLMASSVKGYKSAAKRYQVCAVCGVGMGGTGTQIPDVRKANALNEDMPVFTLQGGFDISKLHGIYKFMMIIMAKTAGKALAKKENRTPDEDKMLHMMRDGGNYVSVENLAGVLDWYEAHKTSRNTSGNPV